MKKTFLLAAAFVLTLGAFAQPDAKTFDKVVKVAETYDFGKIKQGVPVTTNFELFNISDAPVVVENTWAGCGCTTPEKIVEPILPKASAKLKVQFNAAALGPINKDVYIKIAGVDQPKTVKLVGEVLSPEAYDTYMKDKSKSKSE
jgi:hypothetical protein